MNIKKEDIESYKCSHIFDYPPENNFYPKNFDIFPVENDKMLQKYPEKILDEKNCKVWFLQDNIFKLPKGRIKVHFKFIKNLCHNSNIKNMAFSHLLKKIIKLELNEIIYMASEAKLEFKIKIFYDYLEILVEGFNDSLKRGLEIILTKIQSINLNSEKYEEILDLQIKEYIKKSKNFFLKTSYEVTNEYMKKILKYPSIDTRDLIEYLIKSKITIEDLAHFKNNMFLETESNWLIQGNIKKENALEIVQMCNEIFKIDIKKEIFKPFCEERTIEFRKNINYIFYFKNPHEEEKDSSLYSVYQFGRLLNEEKQYFYLLYSILSDKFYDTLRTKETLGYVVYLTYETVNEVQHLVGVIQSSVKDPEFCSSRTRKFFQDMEKEIKEINVEDFNTHLKNRLVDETKKDRDLEEQFDRNWTEIEQGRLKFNVKEENAEFLKKCNKEGLIKFFEKYFVSEIKILDVEYVSEIHFNENEKAIKEQCNDVPGIQKRIYFEKFSDFQGCNPLYPNISNEYYRELIK